VFTITDNCKTIAVVRIDLQGSLRFTPFSGHGLYGLCRGVVAAQPVVEWADLTDLRIPPRGAVSVNESDGAFDEFFKARERVPVVVLVCVNTPIRFRLRVAETTPRLSHGAFQSHGCHRRRGQENMIDQVRIKFRIQLQREFLSGWTIN